MSASDPSNITPITNATSDNAGQSGGMTYGDVENIWIQAGGNPQAAAMAAAVADAESGFNPDASRTNPDGTTSVGLWLIPSNGMPPGSKDPVSNARAALQLSNNGTDWSQWCSTWSDNNCGENGGKYLASGANALASLGQKLTPSSYNVAGAAPAGSGVGASSATQTGASSSSTGGSSSGKSLVLIGLLVLGVVVVVMVVRRREAQKEVAPPEMEEGV